MPDYKNTLNLPQTDFPMKASLSQREPATLNKWRDMSLYANLRAMRKGKEKFILHLGPPYANGHIHLGTAITTLLKDIIVKSKTMSGYDAPLVPGWDCHGLPIEHNVEKKIGKPGRNNLTVAAFREACRDYATSFIDIQREEFKRLGIIADFDHPYLTMDFKYEANIIRALAKIVRNNHVQKGYKPVHWCLDCASALAEAEVEYMEKSSPSIDVRFAVVDNLDFWQRFEHVHKGMGPIFVPIWTTTPWTLPANEAVALNPKLDYVLVAISTVRPLPVRPEEARSAVSKDECGSFETAASQPPQGERRAEQLLIIEDLLPALLTRYGIENHTILGKVRGEKLLGIKLKHPFYDKQVPIVLGEHVTMESGTGAVHTAPAHGVEDFQMGVQYQLPLENPIGDDGCYKSTIPIVGGLHVNKARDVILAALKENHNLIHEETLRHSYPHCWRHKTPLIFRATPQWFISMTQNDLRDQALEAIERVTWIPEWGKTRILGMIGNRPDWCISRQRVWGTPLAFFIHKETGELHPDTVALMEKVAVQVEQRGVEAWYSLDKHALLGDQADQYQQSMDILDVWFDSGVSHECVLKVRPELAFPADIVLEGSDQHRGWFQSSLLTSVAINAVESYKQVLTHGFVVDAQGRKMSKSIGNVIAPEEVIQNLGADILRLWVASVDYRYDINASMQIITHMTETYRRIRNTARFLLANLHGFDPQKHLLPADDMLVLDRWAVDLARRVQADIEEAYTTYQFHAIVQLIHQFCAGDLGSFYLDIIKDRQYTMQADSRGRRSAQTALYHIVQALARWMAPIMSFTAEEIWQYIPGEKLESVLLATWYTDLATMSDHDSMNAAFWDTIRKVRDAVNKEIENQRNANRMGSALEAEVDLYCEPALKTKLDALQEELRFVFLTSCVNVKDRQAAPLDAVTTEVEGLRLKIEPTTNAKCERCWHRRADVNTNKDYPGLCGRCVINVAGPGEERKYA